MTEDEIRSNIFAMPCSNSAFPPGRYRLTHWQSMNISYKADPGLLKKALPSKLTSQ
ncbi:hypothetical protein BH11PSE12_BH11PSE12_10350 [soil metagenome]